MCRFLFKILFWIRKGRYMRETNEKINKQLAALYRENTQELLREWSIAFLKDTPPHRINEFGIFDPQTYNAQQGILFICRETNGWTNKDYEDGWLFRSWMSGIVLHNEKRPAKMNTWHNVARWAFLIQNPETDIAELAYQKDLKSIAGIAFTNINKVRGKKASGKEFWTLANMDTTKKVLQKEIEIINPLYIVCGGTYDIVENVLPDNFKGKIINMPHPGCRKKTGFMLQMLKQQL